jgi:hypothetical protein
MTENPYDKKLEELSFEEQALYDEREIVEQLYILKLAENAHHFGVRFAKQLKHPLNTRICIPDYMDDIEWMNFFTTDKKEIKRKLILIIERLNQIYDRLQIVYQEKERFKELSKQFDYFTHFPVNDVNVVMETVEKLVDGKKKAN